MRDQELFEKLQFSLLSNCNMCLDALSSRRITVMRVNVDVSLSGR
jgi:hypothetical protein